MLYSLMVARCIKYIKIEENLIYYFQIPQILYSALISRFIDTLIKTLALSQYNRIKKRKKERLYERKIFKYIKIFQN